MVSCSYRHGRAPDGSHWLERRTADRKGTYIVDEIAHEGPPDRLTVSARSADFRDEFNVKREVSWHDVTVERVVSAITHRYGLNRKSAKC